MRTTAGGRRMISLRKNVAPISNRTCPVGNRTYVRHSSKIVKNAAKKILAFDIYPQDLIFLIYDSKKIL